MALLLENTPQPLADLARQWSVGDFTALPAIVLLSGADLHGARGAYAGSTATIYLNRDWLAVASRDQLSAVLTEELGHHLDGLLNGADTPGDEGELFALLLSGGPVDGALVASLRAQDDQTTIEQAGVVTAVENATVSIAASANPTPQLVAPAIQRVRIDAGNGFRYADGYTIAINGVSATWETAIKDGDNGDTALVDSKKVEAYLAERISEVFSAVVKAYKSNDSIIVESKTAATFSLAVRIEKNGNEGGGSFSFVTDTSDGRIGLLPTVGSFVVGLSKLSADADGEGPYAYRWQTSVDGVSWLDIANEVGVTYTVVNGDEGRYLRAAATYVDGGGFAEAIATEALFVVTADNGQGVLSAITENGPFVEGVTLVAGYVSDDPDGTAADPAYVYQWFLNDGAIDGANGATFVVGAQGSGSYTVAVTYRDGQAYATTLTSAPQTVAMVDNGQGTLGAIVGDGDLVEGVTLSAGAVVDDPDGAGTITGYQWFRNGSLIGGSTAASHQVAAGAAGAYTVAVSYLDGQGFYTTLASAEAVVVDRTPPMLTGLIVEGSRVTLQLSEPITASAVPAAAFVVSTVDATNRVVRRSISDITPDATSNTRLVLTLVGPPPASTVDLRVSYTDPDGDQSSAVIEDLAGNDLASFTGRYADTYVASGSRVLGGQYQKLVLTGTTNINGTGNERDNVIIGNNAINVLNGAAGADSMDGGDGGDVYLVVSSNEHQTSEISDSGSTGSDELRFASTVAGETITVFAGDDGLERVTIGTGIALAAVTTGTTALNVNAAASRHGLIITGNDGVNQLLGSADADTLIGNGGLDSMNGGEGGDLYLIGNSAEHSAAEVFDSGSTGSDELRFASTTAHQTLTVFAGDTGLERVTIGRGTAVTAVTSATTALNIDAAAAVNGLILTGNDGANAITGTTFDDVIVGNGGRDTLNGGLGNDTLTGGLGPDLFRFNTPLNGSTNVDLITDFTPTTAVTSTDRIDLANTILTGLGPTGTLAANRLVVGSVFDSPLQRIRYEASSGNLFYDPDGNGVQASIVFATLTPGLALTNKQFLVS